MKTDKITKNIKITKIVFIYFYFIYCPIFERLKLAITS